MTENSDFETMGSPSNTVSEKYFFMKKAFIISIILLLPATSSAYSLLQPENPGIRLSRAPYLMLAEEQSQEQPAESTTEQPAPDKTQEQKSPNPKMDENPKILKPVNYWFPIIWDLAPIPALWAWAYKCSTAKDTHEENECSDPLIKTTFISIPLWSIPPDVYIQAPTLAVLSPIGKTLILLFFYWINNFRLDLPCFCCIEMENQDLDYNDRICCEKCRAEQNQEKKDEYQSLLISASIVQVIEMIVHGTIVNRNNIPYNEQQLKKQVYLAPYVNRDRAGFAFQYNF